MGGRDGWVFAAASSREETDNDVVYLMLDDERVDALRGRETAVEVFPRGEDRGGTGLSDDVAE